MRLLTLSKLLLLGGTVAYAYKHRHLFQSRRADAPVDDSGVVAADLVPDPGDPVQGFDEAADLHVADLDVDALDTADAEAAQDLAIMESELDESSLELDTPSQTTLDAHDRATRETGDLYGVHTPRAVDADLPDDRAAMDEGQNWLEAMQTSAVEYGAEPEQDLDPTDEAYEAPHPTDTRDIPVADRGSGGPSGV